MEPIRILICDDHDAFRQGLRAMLATDASLSVIGEAADGAVAVTQAAELQPDVILMDLQMPRLNGLEWRPRGALWPPAPIYASSC